MTGGWAGGVASERATCVLAPNPGPMTLDGTNTWVLAEPGSQECVVVDPGPLHEAHLAGRARPSSPPAGSGWPPRCSPTATSTTPRARPGSPS